MGSKTTTERSLPEFQETFLKETVLPYATEIAEREFVPYEGELVAGLSPLQEQAITGYGGLSMTSPQIQEAQRAYSQLAGFTPTAMQAAQAAPTATFGGATVERTPA